MLPVGDPATTRNSGFLADSGLRAGAGGRVDAKAGPSSVVAICIFMAVFFSTATQLRFGGGVGVGEIFGCLLIAGFAFNLLAGAKVSRAIAANALAIAAFMFSLCVGWIININLAVSQTEQLRDFIAIFYAAGLALVAIHHAGASKACRRALLAGLLLAVVAQLGIFAAATVVALPFEPRAGADSGDRFQGWSTNPNQLGFLLASAPFVAIAAFRSRPYAMGAFLASSIALEFLIETHAVVFGWGAGIAVWFGPYFSRHHREMFRGAPGRKLLFYASVLTGCAVVVVFLPDLVAASLSKNGRDDADGRFPLWLNAIQGWLISPLFGFGPGAHSGADGPFEATEAHSVVLDVLLQGGVFALLALLAIICLCYAEAIRRQHYVMIGLVTSVVVVGLAGNALRHPVFWISLLLPFVTLPGGDRDAGPSQYRAQDGRRLR